MFKMFTSEINDPGFVIILKDEVFFSYQLSYRCSVTVDSILMPVIR